MMPTKNIPSKKSHDVQETYAQQYVNEHIRKAERDANYLKSQRFKNLLDIIKSHPRIDQEDLIYGHVSIDGLTAKGFKGVCEAVFQMVPLVQERTQSFSKYYADYDGVRFHISFAQGSVYWTTVEEQK
jgi:hypothetical protein